MPLERRCSVGFKTVLVNDHFVKQFLMLYEIVQWEGPNLTNLYIEFDRF